MPRFAHGVGGLRRSYRAGSPLVGLIRALIGAGELADVDDGRPLSDLAREGVTGWLEKSWGGLKYFELKFDLCEHILGAVDDTQPEDTYAAERLEQAILEDFGVSIDEAMVGLAVSTTGQRWLRVGPKVMALELEHPGLGWAALREVSAVGVGYGMVDFAFLEMAAQNAYWCCGESEKDWAKEYDEPLSEFSGMTRAEFDEGIPLKRMNASLGPSTARLKAIARDEGWAADVARKVLELRKIGQVRPAFETEKCDEANDLYVSMDVGVVLEWTDTEKVRRIVDDYMGPYMESGEGMKDGIGAIALRLDGGKHMMDLTRQWAGASKRLRAADALLGLIAEDEDAVL